MPEELMIGLLIGSGVVIIGLIIALVAVCTSKKDKRESKADNVKIIDGVRYTTDKLETTEDGDVAVTHRKGDVILERGVTYTVRAGGRIIPGKYTVLSGNDSVDAFNLRIGGIVREYKHATDIVLDDGEKICAVSHAVLLR